LAFAGAVDGQLEQLELKPERQPVEPLSRMVEITVGAEQFEFEAFWKMVENTVEFSQLVLGK
ncbi:hypothetical protein KCU89_g7962, partial [Aureobasidium melanogenum]